MLRVSQSVTEQSPGEGTLEWAVLSTGDVLSRESPAPEVSASEDASGLQTQRDDTARMPTTGKNERTVLLN